MQRFHTVLQHEFGILQDLYNAGFPCPPQLQLENYATGHLQMLNMESLLHECNSAIGSLQCSTSMLHHQSLHYRALCIARLPQGIGRMDMHCAGRINITCTAAVLQQALHLLKCLSAAQVRSLRVGRAEMEARVEETRAKEQAAIAAANALRSDLGLPVPPSQASQADDKKVSWGVLGHPPLLAHWVVVTLSSSLSLLSDQNASVHMTVA